MRLLEIVLALVVAVFLVALLCRAVVSAVKASIRHGPKCRAIIDVDDPSRWDEEIRSYRSISTDPKNQG